MSLKEWGEGGCLKTILLSSFCIDTLPGKYWSVKNTEYCISKRYWFWYWLICIQYNQHNRSFVTAFQNSSYECFLILHHTFTVARRQDANHSHQYQSRTPTPTASLWGYVAPQQHYSTSTLTSERGQSLLLRPQEVTCQENVQAQLINDLAFVFWVGKSQCICFDNQVAMSMFSCC